MDPKLKDFIHNQVSTSCDADPEILTNYVLALLSESKSTADIKSSLREKLQEFFEDETAGFIDRLYNYLDNNKSDSNDDRGQSTSTTEIRSSNRQTAEDEDDDEEDGDRSFKHSRRHRHEDDDNHSSSRTENDNHSIRQKRRLSHEEDTDGKNKYRRNYRPHRDDPEANDMTSGSSSDYRRGGGYQQRYNGRPAWKNSKPMCKDYNEKGYCVRGDLCPYDHGKDTIVYEDRNPLSSQMMPMMPPPPNLPFSMPNMFDKDAFSPENMAMMQNAMTAFPGMMPSPEEFMKTMMKQQPQQQQQQQQQQFGRGGGPMRRGRGGSIDGRGRGRGRGGYGGSDQYSNRQQQPQQRLTTTLVIDNIPPEKCQMIPINDYFKKFGNITNINLLSQKALVQFSTRAEAEAAHASPDVIFDNRFVKVYWHKETSGDFTQGGGPKINDNSGGGGKWKNQQRPEVTHGGGDDISGRTAAAPPPPPASDEPDPSLVAAKAAELQKLRDAKLKMRQEQMKAMLDSQKQREQLLQQQIDEQKKLMAQLTDKSLTQAQKEDLLQSLRKIASDINTSKSDTQSAAAVPPPTATTNPESSDYLKEKLAKLEAEAASMGISPDSMHRPPSYPNAHKGGYYGHGGGGWPPRGGAGGMMKRSLDNRPTKVMIKDIPQETNHDDLKEHFSQFGRMVAFENTENGVVAHYSQRFEAEKAMAMGSNLATGKLSLSWYTNPTTPSSPTV